MAFAKSLSIISLFAAIIAVLVIFSGQKNQLTGFISPDADIREQAYSDSALGEARLTADKSSIENLLRSTVLITAASPSVSLASLKNDLLKDEPESGLDKPIQQGGTSIDLINGKSGQTVVFCKKPSVEFICGAVNLTSKVQQVKPFSTPLKGRHLRLARALANAN